MTAAACCAFHNHIPIAHYGAGIVSTPLTTFDDFNRHCITLWSDITLCEDMESANKAGMLWLTIEKITPIHADWRIDEQNVIFQLEERNIHIVGISHLEDIEVDESLVPEKEYDLVLYNPTTLYKEDIITIGRERFYKNTIWIGPNPDPSFMDLEKIARTPTKWMRPRDGKMIDCPIKFDYYDNLPRAQFMGLLKNCKKFITNSSCAYYEAPLFLKPEQIIMIGDRNKNRSTKFNLELGASDKIVKILKEWWGGKNE